MKCQICSNDKSNSLHKVKEMMYGTGETYYYMECSSCGCLQLIDPLDNVSDFYPGEYYSFKEFKIYENNRTKNIIKNIRGSFFKVRGNMYLNSNPVIKFFAGKFLDFFIPSTQPLASLKLPHFFNVFGEIEISFNKRILDVGSGAGYGLVLMNQYGFSDLTGIDPFIKHDIIYNNSVKILKNWFEDINKEYDIVIFQHSFEHISDPLKIFKHLNNVTHKDSDIIISTPVADSYAWEKYKTNWVQIDAPRHYFIHTKKSIDLLANTNGFYIHKIKYDSSEFQFCGSEQYKAGIPLMDERSYKKNPRGYMFNSSQMRNYKKHSKELNKNGLGDQAVFYLKKNI